MMDIEKILTQSISIYKTEPPQDAWPYIAKVLHPKKKRRVLWLWVFGVMTAVTIIGAYFYNNSNKKFAATTHTNVDTKPTPQLNSTNYTSTTQMSSVTSSQKESIIKASNLILNRNITSSTSLQNAFTTLYNQKDNEIITNKSRPLIKQSNITNIMVNEVALSKLNKEKIIQVGDEVIENEVEKAAINNIPENNKIAEAKFINEDSVELTKLFDTVTKKASIEIAITKVKDTNSTPLNTKKENLAKSISLPSTTKQKQWQYALQVSYGILFINKNNLIGNGTSINKSLTNNLSLGGGAFFQSNDLAGYNNGSYLQLGIFATNTKTKKVQWQLGASLQYNKFSSIAYQNNLSGITYDNGSLLLDSSRGNSSYSASRSYAGSAEIVSIKSKAVSLGVVLGVKGSLVNINKQQQLSLQTQLLPSYNLYTNIQWIDKSTARYFTNKEITSKVQLAQQLSLLWQLNTTKNKLAIGPTYSFSYTNQNKKVNNLQHIRTSSIGLQVQYFFK